MIPNNVISFFNKIVETTGDENESTVRGLLRNTLINAQDIVSASSRRNSNSPLSDQSTAAPPPPEEKIAIKTPEKPSSSKEPGRRADSCRVCLKNFKPEDYSRLCSSCKMKVCEDCASYCPLAENEDQSMWSCSVCRRKQQNAAKLMIAAQDSQDSLLDVPIVDTLQRRHSDLKISSSSSGSKMTSLGSGLAPPRSPELRRHSDVSPASLKEIEKVASEKREEMRWERELEWRQKQRSGSAGSTVVKSKTQELLDGRGVKNDDHRPRDLTPTRKVEEKKEDSSAKRQQSKTSLVASPTTASHFRRKSQVTAIPKQHSCDDNNKTLVKKTSSNTLGGQSAGAGMSRRASAYDIFQTRTEAKSDTPERRPSSYRVARTNESTTSSSSSQQEAGKPSPERRSSYRITSADNNDESMKSSIMERRPSYRLSSTTSGGTTTTTKSSELSIDDTRACPERRHSYRVPGSTDVEKSNFERRSSYRLTSHGDNDNNKNNDSRRSSSTDTTGSQQQQFRRGSIRPYEHEDSPRRSIIRRKSGEGDASSSGGGGSMEQAPPEFVTEELRARRRGSQLPDINAIKAGILPSHGGLSPRSSLTAPQSVMENHPGDLVRRQSSQTGEDIKIVIDDVDKLDLEEPKGTNIPSAPLVRRVVLTRDPNERIHKTRGFGMRVVGGKPGQDGTLYTYIVWTMPGGPAEKANLKKGDKILQLCGINLMNLPFDEVSHIMDRTGDVIDMIVETQGITSNGRFADGKDDGIRRKAPEIVEPTDHSVSPTRRKLPKTPLELQEAANTEEQSSSMYTNMTSASYTISSYAIKDNRYDSQGGRIQLQLWSRDKNTILVVSILAADNLPQREDYHFGGHLPEAYVRIRLLPSMKKGTAVYSEVAEPNQNPIWNTTLEIRADNNNDNVLEKAVEVTVWDQRPDGEQVFLGEVIITDIDMAIDQPVWYRIETESKHFPESPTPSMEGLSSQRSLSEEEGTDVGCGFLHPDHAYLAGSRRGSSQSEQLEVEPYQLNKDFSRSLPGSRRSSFQSGQVVDKDIPPIVYPSKGRRRSSCTPRPDPDEILKNLKAVKGELLGRSMSICAGNWTMRRRSSERKRESTESVLEVAEPTGDEKQDISDYEYKDDRKLGPCQLEPRYNTVNKAINIELNLCLSICKGQLMVEVVSARGITPTDPLPDTYVKTYLRDNDRLLCKRKTRVVTKSCTPEFNQVLKYSIKELSEKSLVVMLWSRQKGFEHNHGLGAAEIRTDILKLSDHVTGWYPLFPVQKIGSESNDSP